MKDAIEKVLKKEQVSNAMVVCYEGLTTDIAEEHNATFLISGLRNAVDYAYKENLAQINEEISRDEMDTIYIRAGRLGRVSSSRVMELLQAGRDVSTYVPEEILEIM